MNIAFDIDGVLTDINKFQIEYGKKFFKNKKIVNEAGYSIREIFDCTKEEEYKFWVKYLIYYTLNYPPRIGASELIQKLILEGNKIFIISSRIKCFDDDLIGKLIRKFVFIWLKKNNILYDKILFCSIENSPIEKAKYCVKYGIDYIIEDTVSNIDELIKVTNVICFYNKYNSTYDKTVIAQNFNQIYQIINNKSYNFKYLNKQEKEKLNLSELKQYYENLKKYYTLLINRNKLKRQEKLYSNLYPILNNLLKIKYSYKVINEDKIPNKKGIIFVANHRDMIDPPLIMSVIGNRNVHLLLKSEFLDTAYSLFLKNIGCIFVKRDDIDSRIISKEELIKIILNGGDIIIFPEGTRNKTDKDLLDFKLGAVSIAQITGAPIVPIAINKYFDDYHENIIIKVGEEIFVKYDDDICEKNMLLMDCIKKMYMDTSKEKILKLKKM